MKSNYFRLLQQELFIFSLTAASGLPADSLFQCTYIKKKPIFESSK